MKDLLGDDYQKAVGIARRWNQATNFIEGFHAEMAMKELCEAHRIFAGTAGNVRDFLIQEEDFITMHHPDTGEERLVSIPNVIRR